MAAYFVRAEATVTNGGGDREKQYVVLTCERPGEIEDSRTATAFIQWLRSLVEKQIIDLHGDENYLVNVRVSDVDILTISKL